MILSHKQIEEIAAAVTKDFNEFFFGKDADIGRSTAQATPIDQFAKDYLGLSVSFAHLSSDGSLCGLTAYADTEYTIEQMCEILSNSTKTGYRIPKAHLFTYLCIGCGEIVNA